MEANMIILRTQHYYKPALMRHHKNAVVHSSVRLPAFQAKVGMPPPGSARVAVVGVGVVLACALGAMYWKRARAQPIIRSNPTCHVGKNGSSIQSEEVEPPVLKELLHQICLRTSDSSKQPPVLKKLFDKYLIGKDKTNALEEKILNLTPTGQLTEQEHLCGLVLTLVLINEKDYARAKNICDKLQTVMSGTSDKRPKFLSVVISKMMDMKKQSSNTPETMVKLVDDAWEEMKKEDNGFPGFGDGPPMV